MIGNKQDETAQSPSWRKLELENRSTSFPAAVNIQNPLRISASFKGPHDRRKNITEGDSVTSWTKALQSLAQGTRSSLSRKNTGGLNRKTVDMEPFPRSPQRIPVLTMTLIKLHDVFETFCRHLTDATYINAQTACLFLDSAGIATSPKTAESSSPVTIVDSPSSHRSSSPSRSPIASWFIGSQTSESDYSQKSEWEKSCNPLIIFAGLEVIYSACSHVESHVQALTLVRLYKKTTDDLRLIRETLCDPFVYSTGSETSLGLNSMSSYQEKAATLSFSIEAIMSLCGCRCKMIEQQTRLCSSESIDVGKVIASFKEIPNSIPKLVGKSEPIVKSILQEVEGWCNIMETYFSFGKYRFMNTIVGCQRIKLKLNTSSNTCIQKWICKVYQSFVSMLPIYFESVGSDVISRYGYQESSFCVNPGDNKYGPNLDFEAKLQEFLQSEERNGTPFAVAVVAGVAGFHRHWSISNHGLLTIGNEELLNTGQSILEPSDILSAYPAVYIRTTIEQNFSSKVLGKRRNSGKNDNDYDHMLEKSLSNSINSKREINCWPYTSWNNIIQMLKNSIPLSSERSSVGTKWLQVDSDTSVYALPLQNAVWLVAMKKTNDDYGLNQQNEEEHFRKERKFFSDFATSLRLRDIFKSNLKTNHDGADSLLDGLSNALLENRISDNAFTSQLLESFKRIFGLRSLGDRNGIQSQKQKAVISPSSLEGFGTWSSPYPSHFAFFLGNHLMETLGNE